MTTRRQIQKAREERFVKSLEEAVDTLADIIDAVESGEEEDFVEGVGVVEVLLAKAKRRLEWMEG